MSYYRIYGLDPAGHITFGDHFECRDDAHAVEIARGMLGRFPAVEVWQEARRIGAVFPDAPAVDDGRTSSPPAR
jgi:hypothetical protein